MKWISMILGILMISGFKFTHIDDGVPTSPWVYAFGIIYILCATALIIVPIIKD